MIGPLVKKEYSAREKMLRGVAIALIILILLVIVAVLFAIDPRGAIKASPRYTIPGAIVAIVSAWYTYRRVQERKRDLQKSTAQPITTLINVKCPYCQNIFQIPPQQKLHRVKCPMCSRESRLP